MEQKLYDAAAKLPETKLTFDAIQPAPMAPPINKTWRIIISMAACFILLISAGFGSYAYATEVKEYNEAVRFFKDYGLSTEGLSRSEIKAVYRDITTNAFSYSKTAEVIANSITDGYEIFQNDPTPEDVERLWNSMNSSERFPISGWTGIHYRYRAEYKEDPKLGYEVLDKSYIEKYDGDTLLWSTPVSGFRIDGLSTVSDGVIAYGNPERWGSGSRSYAWMAKIGSDGSFQWKHMLNNGFEDEYIAEVLENADGTYAVISRGDYQYFCLSQCTADGKINSFQKTEVGNYGIWNAARLGDGYIVQLGSYMTNEHARIVKVDHEGNITESFSYSSEDAYYYITDMIGFNGKIYLSAYAVPKLDDEEQSAGGRYEIANILNYIFDNKLFAISSEELTPLVRDNYTAMLLVCDPEAGTPREFYSVQGSLGGKLALSDGGMLLWDVESITTTSLSIATSAYTIRGTSYVFRYTFDPDGSLVSQEKTDEVTDYYR